MVPDDPPGPLPSSASQHNSQLNDLVDLPTIPETISGIAFEGWELEHFLLETVQSTGVEEGANLEDAIFMSELMDCDFQSEPLQLPVDEYTRDSSIEWMILQEEAGSADDHAKRASKSELMGMGRMDHQKARRIAPSSMVVSSKGSDQNMVDVQAVMESEDVTVRFPHRQEVTIEGFSAVAAEDSRQGSTLVLTNPAMEMELERNDEEEGEDAAREASSCELRQTMNLKLLHLLLACAEAVAEEKMELATVILHRLQELASARGTPMQRLSVYFAEALTARIIPSASLPFIRRLNTALPQCDMLEAFCVFYNVNPIGKFCHLTLNQVILDTTAADSQVHLVDLHIGYGMQWAAFLQAVALRPNGPPKLRLTALGRSAEALHSTGTKLTEMAANLQVPFEFCPLVVQLHDFDVRMLDHREEEICVISSLGQLHTLLQKGGDYVDRFLQGLKSMEPKVFAFAENDANHNNDDFLVRFVECLKYYFTVFDALDAALPATSQARLKMERLLAGRKIGSITACEGEDRAERHETMLDWMKRMEAAGFKGVQLGNTALNQANLLLNLYYPNGYSLTEDNGAFTLRWNGTALMAVGAWC